MFAPSRVVFLRLKADHLIRVVVPYFIRGPLPDLCNRSITHTMTMTIEPAPDPDFVDPPQDQDLDCGGVNDPPSFILFV